RHPNPIRDAPAPFSGVVDTDTDDPAPDFIIRSNDGVDLHVHRGILHYASVFFRDLLGAWDGKPIAKLPESCTILHRLLCIAYPQTSLDYLLTEQTLDGLYEVHEAAQKLRDLPELARKAALSTLKTYTEALSASAFQKLHEFHHSCGKAAEQLAIRNAKSITHYEHPGYGYEFVWWTQGKRPSHSEECRPKLEYFAEGDWAELTPSPWFQHHMAVVASKLRRIPIRETVNENGCGKCIEHAERELVDFGEQLGERIKESNNRLGAL
ncbi:hypothetical protein C8F04DRAFT_1157717, partial [Mycena alexandri]